MIALDYLNNEFVVSSCTLEGAIFIFTTLMEKNNTLYKTKEMPKARESCFFEHGSWRKTITAEK